MLQLKLQLLHQLILQLIQRAGGRYRLRPLNPTLMARQMRRQMMAIFALTNMRDLVAGCLLVSQLIAIPLRASSESPKASALADPPLICHDRHAIELLVAGYDLQNDHNTEAALIKYKACLALEPACVSCLYELGWSNWKQGDWNAVIKTWEAALKIDAKHPKILEYLATARENLKIVEAKDKVEVFRQKTNLMVQSEPADAPVSITFVGR